MKRVCAAFLIFISGLIVGVFVERLLLHSRKMTGRTAGSEVAAANARFAGVSRTPQELAPKVEHRSSGLTLAEIEIILRRCVAMPDSVEVNAEAVELAGAVRSEDRLAAVRLADRVPFSPARTSFTTALFERWTVSDPLAVVTYLSNAPRGRLSDELFGTVARAWAGKDPKAAIAWVTNLPPGSLKRGALRNLISAWSYRDPAAAANFAMSLPSGRDQQDSLSAIAERWAGAE